MPGTAWPLIETADAPALYAQSQELFWHQNYEDALEEARRTGKPIFLEYRCSP